jgi:hypothetical protein
VSMNLAVSFYYCYLITNIQDGEAQIVKSKIASLLFCLAF